MFPRVGNTDGRYQKGAKVSSLALVKAFIRLCVCALWDEGEENVQLCVCGHQRRVSDVLLRPFCLLPSRSSSTEPRARLAVSRSQQSSCLCPTPHILD